MKIWKRYLLFGISATVITFISTFYLYRHVKFKYSYKSQLADKLDKILAFNTNPSAIFYDLYERSPLYSDLKELDRKAITNDNAREFLMKPNTALNYKTHGINVGLSDLVALNREVPDSRPYGFV
jgi:hypothetical protein